MEKLKLLREGKAVLCESCRQSDMFDPDTNQCTRCGDLPVSMVTQSKLKELQQEYAAKESERRSREIQSRREAQSNKHYVAISEKIRDSFDDFLKEELKISQAQFGSLEDGDLRVCVGYFQNYLLRKGLVNAIGNFSIVACTAVILLCLRLVIGMISEDHTGFGYILASILLNIGISMVVPAWSFIMAGRLIIALHLRAACRLLIKVKGDEWFLEFFREQRNLYQYIPGK